MRKNQFWKVKNSLLQFEKDFIELKDRKLKRGELKIKRGTEELFLKQIIVSIDDMDKFEQKKWRIEGQLKTLGMTS